MVVIVGPWPTLSLSSRQAAAVWGQNLDLPELATARYSGRGNPIFRFAGPWRSGREKVRVPSRMFAPAVGWAHQFGIPDSQISMSPQGKRVQT